MNITVITGLRYLIKTKKRTLLTILGIIMSVALVCGTALIGDNLKLQAVRTARQIYGAYHVMFGGLTEEQAVMLTSNIKIDACGFSRFAGNADIGGKAVLSVEGRDETFRGLRAETLSAGSWPENSGEIAVEKWALNMLGDPELGASVKLLLVPGEEKAGFAQDAGGSEPEDAEISGRGSSPLSAQQKTFVLTGIIENRTWSRRSNTALAVTVFSGGAGDAGPVTAAVTFEEGIAIQKAVSDIQREYGLKQNAVMQNNPLLGAMRESKLLRANNAVFMTELIFILIIVIVTVGVIYNSFAISVAERNREFGLFRAAGAGPGQIRRIVFMEAGMVSIIGIPLGLFFGIAAIKVLALVAGFGEVGLNLSRIDVRPAVPLAASLIGFAAVLFSALLPAISAGRISPMAAILNRRSASLRKRRRGPLVRIAAFFGFEGELALLNIGRSRKKFLVTLFSLCIGVCLFITFSSFAGLMRKAMEGSLSDPLVKDVSLDQWPHEAKSEIPASLVDEISGKPYVESLMKVRYGRAVLLADERRFEPEYLRFLETESISGFESGPRLPEADALSSDAESGRPRDKRPKNAAAPVDVFGFGKKEFDAFASKISAGSTDYHDFKKGVLIWPQYRNEDGRHTALNVEAGASIRILGSSGSPVELTVSGIIDQPPMKGDMRALAPVVIAGEQTFERITGRSGYSLLGIELADGAVLEQAVSDLEGLSAEGGDIKVTDHQLSYRRQRELIRQMEILFFGLVTVVSLIGMINIINTINTNIILRVKEFGTLRAVGMTGRQLKIMVVTEGIITALAAVLFGSIAGIGLSRLFFSNINTVQSIVWTVPWRSIAAAGAAAIALGALSSLPPFKRINRLTVVDAIRTIE